MYTFYLFFIFYLFSFLLVLLLDKITFIGNEQLFRDIIICNFYNLKSNKYE